jgi:hypothetical protein
VNDALFNRRKRMMTLLAARNKPSYVFKAVAEEFNVPVGTVRRDYYNMNVIRKKRKDGTIEEKAGWIHAVQQEEQATAIAVENFDIGVRIATETLLTIQPLRPGAQLTLKQQFLKIQALQVYIRANVEDYKFKQSIGQITRKPEEVINHDYSIGMPFACDPEIKRVLLERAEEQRKQKELREQQRTKDAAESSQT